MPKNILITGAAGNLGTAVTSLLIKEGYQVTGTVEPGHSHPDSGAVFYECDLTSESATSGLFNRIQQEYASLDAAVLLVGGFGMNSIENASSQDMMQMFTLNYMTAFHASKEAYSWMKQHGGGKLIFIGGKPAVEGGAAALLPYAVSKSAVIKLAEIINESGTKDNIQASVIIPSVIDTPQNRKSMPDADFDNWVKAEQIAETIGVLISEKSRTWRKTVLKLYNNS